MAYKIRYRWHIDWVGPGQGPMVQSPDGRGGGNAQTLTGVDNGSNALAVTGSGTNSAITSADVTTLTNAMAADIATQANAKLQILQSFVAGLGSSGGVIGS